MHLWLQHVPILRCYLCVNCLQHLCHTFGLASACSRSPVQHEYARVHADTVNVLLTHDFGPLWDRRAIHVTNQHKPPNVSKCQVRHDASSRDQRACCKLRAHDVLPMMCPATTPQSPMCVHDLLQLRAHDVLPMMCHSLNNSIDHVCS